MKTRICGFAAVVFLSGSFLGFAQTTDLTRRAFVNIKSDDKPRNCEDAMRYLFKYRAKLKDELLRELYQTDRQGRDAILLILFQTPGFIPDQRFARFVMTRLPEQDQVVENNDLLFREGAHWWAWRFIDKHYTLFEPLLQDAVGATRDPWILWGVTWIFKKHKTLEANGDLYTPVILRRAANNLRNDELPYNASQTARTFLLLGDRSLEVLRETQKSTDAQARLFARALLDGMTKRQRNAFGYLNSELALDRNPFGMGRDEPEWLGELTRKYFFEGKTYP
jgi:hypothetical protein